MNIMLLLPAKQTLNSAQSARARGGLRKPIQSIKIGHMRSLVPSHETGQFHEIDSLELLQVFYLNGSVDQAVSPFRCVLGTVVAQEYDVQHTAFFRSRGNRYCRSSYFIGERTLIRSRDLKTTRKFCSLIIDVESLDGSLEQI